MTSEQRREARYRRRQTRRQAKRKARSDALGPIEEVFSYRAMFFYGRKCCNGVRWKASTQRFEMHLFSGTAKRRRKILNGTWKPGKTAHFTLKERGKVRPIDAPHIEDRQVYKVLTKKVLVPLYMPSMIYDNKASLFLMDFHHFFPDAPHALLYERHRGMILNPDLRQLADLVVAAVPGGVGMPLGVEPSQQEMVALPSSLDNRIKAQLSIHGAAHYMDDYYTILPSKQAAEVTAADVIGHAEAMGLQVNAGKSKVVPFSRPFRFCKAKFQVTDTGAVKIHGCRDGMKRARRKLRLFQARVASGEMTVEQVAQWLQTPISYYENFNDHGRVLKLRRLFYAIFKTEV